MHSSYLQGLLRYIPKRPMLLAEKYKKIQKHLYHRICRTSRLHRLLFKFIFSHFVLVTYLFILFTTSIEIAYTRTRLRPSVFGPSFCMLVSARKLLFIVAVTPLSSTKEKQSRSNELFSAMP